VWIIYIKEFVTRTVRRIEELGMCELEIRAWLETRLQSRYGAHCADVRLDARMAGITKGQLSKARKDLKVKTINILDRSGRPTGEHKWVLR